MLSLPRNKRRNERPLNAKQPHGKNSQSNADSGRLKRQQFPGKAFS